MGSAPRIFLSSTYYDLRQIRADLNDFLEGTLGYEVLASEQPSFPVDPDRSLIENCRQRIEKDADILILIVGGRYGFVEPSSSKSVTNLEYLTARAKGIPIYAFIEKNVLALLPIWEDNPDANFARVTEDPRVFGFIRQLRSIDRIWTHDFERAQDITRTLRLQFAHLMKNGLSLRLATAGTDILGRYTGLSPAAFRLLLEQPFEWEHRLFAQVARDETVKNADLRNSHRFNIILGKGEHIDDSNALEWSGERSSELLRTIAAIDKIVNEALPRALRPAGVPSDVEELIFSARMFGRLHREFLEWSLRVKHSHTSPRFTPLMAALAKIADNSIKTIEDFPDAALSQIERIASLPPDERTPLRIGMNLQADTTDVMEELERATQKPSSRPR